MPTISRSVLFMLRPKHRPVNGAGHRITLPAHAVGVSPIAKPTSPSHSSYPAALPGPAFPTTAWPTTQTSLISVSWSPFCNRWAYHLPASVALLSRRAASVAERVWILGP